MDEYLGISFVHADAIDFDAGVGADPGARAASGTFVGVSHIGEMIAAVVDLVWLKRESVGGTGHDAKVASFASLNVDSDSSFYFCHCCYLVIFRGVGIIDGRCWIG